MKVLVSLGTQKQQFTRILNFIENSKELEKSDILAQTGHTKFSSDRIKIVQFMNQDEFDLKLDEADIVICHGGVGTIFSALKKGKKVLAVPRLAKYSEHVDDHQLEICKELEKEGYILYINDLEDFDAKIKELLSKKFKTYISDTSYLEILRKEI